METGLNAETFCVKYNFRTKELKKVKVKIWPRQTPFNKWNFASVLRSLYEYSCTKSTLVLNTFTLQTKAEARRTKNVYGGCFNVGKCIINLSRK